MAAEITSPVPLSTPDNHVFLDTESTTVESTRSAVLSDDAFFIQYEIERTLNDIRKNKWSRVALQFPDDMLSDSARVYQMLARGYAKQRYPADDASSQTHASAKMATSVEAVEKDFPNLAVQETPPRLLPLKLTILADTSYGSCCVDEIAAEHVEADVVVHYGRTCLSPTSRLPVIYVYTKQALDHHDIIDAFMQTFPDKTAKVIVMADVPYSHHVGGICEMLRQDHGYEHIHAAEIRRNIGDFIPNRTLPPDVETAGDNEAIQEQLKTWSIVHISNPPTALLLTLESRVKSVHILSTQQDGNNILQNNTAQVLRRRYALITSLNTVSIWGILINTLSVKNYLHIVDHVKQQIANAGKKSYLFVVGKLNPAKVANFAEIGGWIVIGCWESSLIDSRDFYRPVITPFELALVLKSDEERIWTGEWRGDFQGVLDQTGQAPSATDSNRYNTMPGTFLDDDDKPDGLDEDDHGSDDESAPPEFDLRTGKYVSRTRPMRKSQPRATVQHDDNPSISTALTKRANGDILVVNGVASPAAEYLAQKRTWRGLGSDIEVKYDNEDEQGRLVEEGRTGVARGYTTGDSPRT